MQKSTAKRRVASPGPEAAIALAAPRGGDEGTRFGLALVAFMRVTAALWLAEGVGQWTVVLSTGRDGLSLFVGLAPLAMVAAVFFAVVDFIASVGLWMAAPWGGVIWLVSVGAQVLVIVVMPGFFDHPVAMGLADVLLMATYLALVWFAAQAAEGEL